MCQMTNRINARELFKLKLKYIASSLRGLLIFHGGLLFGGLLTGGLLSGPTIQHPACRSGWVVGQVLLIRSAVRFWTRAFRNVMFELRISLFAALAKGRLRRLALKRKLEDARYRYRWLWRRGHARTVGKQTEPQLEPATFAGIILPETEHSCCYARYSCGNNCMQRCRQTHARVWRSDDTIAS